MNTIKAITDYITNHDQNYIYFYKARILDEFDDYIDVADLMGKDFCEKLSYSILAERGYYNIAITCDDIEGSYSLKKRIGVEYLNQGDDLGYGYFTKQSLEALHHRKNIYCEKEFDEKILLLKNKLKAYGIDNDEVVIVNGMSMEASGIRKAEDVDLIIRKSSRIALDRGNHGERIDLGNDIEVKPFLSYMIDDDIIISNSVYFYCMFNMKFMDIRFMLKKKPIRSLRKPKVRKDIWLIIKYLIQGGKC